MKKRLKALLERDPRCTWCGCHVIPKLDPKQPFDDNHATVDHLYSRRNPKRWAREEAGTERTVLACHKCNQRRDRDEKWMAEELRRMGIDPYDGLREVAEQILSEIDEGQRPHIRRLYKFGIR